MNGEVEKICGYQPHPIAKLIPPMTDAELQRLTKDIAENGLREAITIYEGKILDGIHRGKACETSGVTPRFVEWDGAGGSPVKWVVSKNLHRRHLNESQLGMLGADSDEWLKLEAKALERRMNNLKKTDAKPADAESAPVRSREDQPGKTAEKVAELVGVSPRYVEMAKALKKKNPELAQKVRDGKISLKKADKEVSRAEAVRRIKAYVPPSGRYQVIVADPSWMYDDDLDGSDEARGGCPYPPQTLEEIMATPIPADDNAILFLWTTNAHMEEAHQVMRHWGFTKKTIGTWDKRRTPDDLGAGRTLRNVTEHFLVGIKGRMVLTLTNQSTLIQEGRSNIHSEKPEKFYKLVESLCPSTSRIELWSRRMDRPGWQTSGAEVGLLEKKKRATPTKEKPASPELKQMKDLERECKVRGFSLILDEQKQPPEVIARCNECDHVSVSALIGDNRAPVPAELIDEIREHTCDGATPRAPKSKSRPQPKRTSKAKSAKPKKKKPAA